MSTDLEDPRPGMFAIMWDCHGLEACERVPNPADTTFALLKGVEPPQPPNILHWQLRARYNSQRHYEIYIITATPGISEDDIRAMFDANPQHAADTIRRIGHQYYSDRAQEDRVVIR
jgi:hypothetical protein